MALEYSRLFASQQLGTSAATVFTLGATGDGRVLRNLAVVFVNTTASAVDIEAFVGGSAASNQFLKQSLAGNSRIEVSVPKMIGGDTFVANAGTASAITISELDGVVRKE